MKPIKLQTSSKAVLYASISLCLAFSAACSNDESLPEPTANCQIISHTSNGNVAGFTYNSSGKIQSYTDGESYRTYLYTNNTIVVSATYQEEFLSKTIVTMNEDDLPINIRTERNMSGTDWTNETLEYNGDQLMKVTGTNDEGGSPIVAIYTWQNGNMVSLSNGNSTISFEFFEEHLIQSGDYYYMTNYLLYGVTPLRNKNLVKSIDSGEGNVTNFDYEFDEDGKISALTAVTSSDSNEIDFQYQCE